MDGRNIEDLICVLQEVATLDSMGPVLIHVITDENQGEENSQKSDITDRQQDGIVFPPFCLNYIVCVVPLDIICYCKIAYPANIELTLLF